MMRGRSASAPAALADTSSAHSAVVAAAVLS
jgi:hypothetical protein